MDSDTSSAAADRTPKEGRGDWRLAGLLILFASVAVYFTIKIPAFETPDEFQHYAFVQHVVTWFDLPKSEPDTPGLWRQQGVQAPLYYIAGALLTIWVDHSEFPTTAHRVNFFAKLGVNDAQDNRNFFMPHADDGWPWRKEFLALHILRIFSVGLACLSLYALHRFLILFLERRTALLGVAVCAFIPQFVFISAAASNDNLVVLAGCLVVWQLAEWIRKWSAEPQSALYRHAWRIGLLLALALLAKLSGIGLLGVAGAAAAWIAWRRRSFICLWSLSWRMAVPVVAGSGWWFLRNLWLYQDPLAWNIWRANITLRPGPLTLGQLATEFPALLKSFWGLFGWLTVPFPPLVYGVALALVALVGILFLFWLRKTLRTQPTDAYLLESETFASGFLAFLWLGVLTLSWLRFSLIAQAAQGRYFFPAMAAYGLAIGLGCSFLSARFQKLAGLIPAAMLALCIATPTWILDPAYEPPDFAQHAGEALAARQAVSGADLTSPELRLVGLGLPTDVVPGRSYPVFLRMQAIGEVTQDYAFFFHYRDEEGQIVAQYDGLPGGGMWPTTQWRQGETRTDRIYVHIPADLEPGTHGNIVMGLYNPWTWMRAFWQEAGGAPSETPPNEIVVESFEVKPAQ